MEEDKLIFNCPECGKEYSTSIDSTGDMWRCICGQRFSWRKFSIPKESYIRLTSEQIEEIHYRYLTDKSLQIFNSRIVMIMSMAIPSYRKNKTGNLEVIYSTEDMREIKGIEKLRDDYIKDHYPELIYIGEIDAINK